MRGQDRGKRAVAERPIEVAGHEEPRQALEVDLRHEVVGALHLAEDRRPERCLLGQRQQAGRREDVPAHVVGARLPRVERRQPRRRKPIVVGAIRCLPGARGAE